ncbi:MAG: GNAT family N-acetyltransferase [Bacteroidia bacterium]|nr:GNAT family N-acetyltransferase [Bacteroidia bacterium]
MIHQLSYQTTDLQLLPLQKAHATFIKLLLNTTGWLNNIGNRHVYTLNDAHRYIEKTEQIPAAYYWVIFHKQTQQCVGLNTMLKRNYLPHADIGFALLPQFMGKGIAYQSTQILLQKQLPIWGTIAGITLPANSPSINLLTKLGLVFKRSMQQDNEWLLVFETVNS